MVTEPDANHTAFQQVLEDYRCSYKEEKLSRVLAEVARNSSRQLCTWSSAGKAPAPRTSQRRPLQGGERAGGHLCAALSLSGPDSRSRLAVWRILCLSSR